MLERASFRCPPRYNWALHATVEDRNWFNTVYQKREADDSIQDWIKFHLLYAFAAAAKQPADEMPSAPGVLHDRETPGSFWPSGTTCHRRFKKLVYDARRGDRQAFVVLWDLLNSKKAAPVLSDRLVGKKALACFESLTNPRLHERHWTPSEWTDLKWDDSGADVQNYIRKIAFSIFAGETLGVQYRDPSLSACFESSRAKMGSIGFLKSFLDVYDYLSPPTMVSMVEVRQSIRRELVSSDEVESDVNKATQQAMDEEESSVGDITDHDRYGKMCRPEVQTIYVPNYFEVLEGLWSENLHYVRTHIDDDLPAKIVPIREPLKCRFISKGPSRFYWAATLWQRFLWNRLKRYPIFRLISRPCEGSDIESLLPLAPNEVLVSGDYSDATNNLDPEMISAAVDGIVNSLRVDPSLIRDHNPETEVWTDNGVMGTWLEKLLRRTLSNHLIVLDKHNYDDQIWGQLMGSPTSFPILCLINAAVICYSLRVPVEGFKTFGRVLVNGDDCLFPASPEQYDRWIKCTGYCGLKRSPGKNYCSSEFGIINTKLFIFQKDKRTCTYYPFLNQALLYNRVSKGRDAGRTVRTLFPDLGDRLRSCLEGFRDLEQRKKIQRIFCEENRLSLAYARLLHLSKAAPISLGGLGFPDQVDVSIRACRRAAFLMCSRKRQPYVQRDHPVDTLVSPSVGPLVPKSDVDSGDNTPLFARALYTESAGVCVKDEEDQQIVTDRTFRSRSIALLRRYRSWFDGENRFSLEPACAETVLGYSMKRLLVYPTLPPIRSYYSHPRALRPLVEQVCPGATWAG